MNNEEREKTMDDGTTVKEMQKALLDAKKVEQDQEMMEKARERAFKGLLPYDEFERIFGQKAIRVASITLWRARGLAAYAVMPLKGVGA